MIIYYFCILFIFIYQRNHLARIRTSSNCPVFRGSNRNSQHASKWAELAELQINEVKTIDKEILTKPFTWTQQDPARTQPGPMVKLNWQYPWQFSALHQSLDRISICSARFEVVVINPIYHCCLQYRVVVWWGVRGSFEPSWAMGIGERVPTENPQYLCGDHWPVLTTLHQSPLSDLSTRD